MTDAQPRALHEILNPDVSQMVLRHAWSAHRMIYKGVDVSDYPYGHPARRFAQSVYKAEIRCVDYPLECTVVTLDELKRLREAFDALAALASQVAAGPGDGCGCADRRLCHCKESNTISFAESMMEEAQHIIKEHKVDEGGVAATAEPVGM